MLPGGTNEQSAAASGSATGPEPTIAYSSAVIPTPGEHWPGHAHLERFRAEERVNFFTHALGLLISLIGAVVLISLARETGDFWKVFGCSVYSASAASVFAASTLSHAFERPRLRHFFRTLDQVCIFFMIAGTYTPFAVVYMRDGWVAYLLVAVWILAFTGAFVKLFVTRLGNISTAFYVLLGWLPAMSIPTAIRLAPISCLSWVLAGGVLYTIGTIFLVLDHRVKYFHGVWHVLVVSASVCHFVAVLKVVLPQ